MPFSTLFWNIYTNSICSLMLNTEIQIYTNQKKSKKYLGAPMVKEAGSEDSLLEIYTIPNSTLFWSIYTKSVCSLM